MDDAILAGSAHDFVFDEILQISSPWDDG